MIDRIRPVAAIGALLLILAACGGDTGNTTAPTLPTLNESAAADADTGVATTTTEAVDPEEAMLEYTACMREHGIDIPDPGGSGGDGFVTEGSSDGLDFSAFEQAESECSPILEEAFGVFELTPEQEVEVMDQQLAFAQCMRDEGIDWPDPDPSQASTFGIELGDDLDPDKTNAAMEKCSEGIFGGGSYGTSEGGVYGTSRDGVTP